MGVSVKPALGKSWAHIADTRIFLQAVDRGEDERNKRQASLMKSSRNRVSVGHFDGCCLKLIVCMSDQGFVCFL